jgi:hypothetical protein
MQGNEQICGLNAFESGRQDARDGDALIVESDLMSNDVRVCAKALRQMESDRTAAYAPPERVNSRPNGLPSCGLSARVSKNPSVRYSALTH